MSAFANDESPVQPQHSSHLDSLLSKLRPFQREAFDFAVHGICESTKAASSKRNKRGAAAKRPNNNNNNDTAECAADGPVAGAGTGRILLGDEMGLGKTLSSLAIMSAYQNTEWPLLILCPASLRYTWPAEIEKFCPWIPSTSIHVVRGKDDVQFAVKIQKWNEMNRSPLSNMNGAANLVAYSQSKSTAHNHNTTNPIQIVIVTYSLLQSRFQVANVLKSCNFQCIIADESHNLKQLSSQRCQLALPLLQNSKRLVLLSGTPALNRPVELWPQITALDPSGKIFGKYGMRYNEFTKRYCNAKHTRFGWDVKGVSNAEELHEVLKTIMLRRLKAEVLHDLPQKQRTMVPVTVEKEKERECRDIIMQMNAARQYLTEIEIMDLGDDEDANSARWEAKRLLMQAYQASGIAKAPSTTEYILDWLEGSGTQKLVVFAHHKEVLDYIEKTISAKYKGKLGMMRIDGSVPPAERALRVKKFQCNVSLRVALLSMTAAGVGLTLTAASSIVFAELHWTPGVLAQAEDRCHRIGQVNSVNVMYCICKDEEVSVDMSLWGMLGRKIGALGRVVDGQRGKGMNAEEADDKKPVVSAEEDLASFFASSTSALQGSKKGKCPLVKGTIQSFFTKQADNAKAGSSKSTHKTKQVASKAGICSTISLVDDSDGDCSIRTGIDTTTESYPHPFTCHACTYQNESGEACKMCGTARRASASHERIKIVDKWTCNVCTYDNQNRESCEMCGTLNDDAMESADDNWTCTGCTLINNTTDKTCLACGRMESRSGKGQGAHLSRVSQSPATSIEFVALDEADSASESGNLSSTNDASSPAMAKDHVAYSGLLSFSISKNSGRIALHKADSGDPLYANFDISQVLTEECSNELEDAQLSRKAPGHKIMASTQLLSFDDRGVMQVISSITEFPGKGNLDVMSEELKSFVSQYMELRELEKKTLKDSGLAVTPSALRSTVASLVISTITGETCRYTGGAKEKAILALRNNCGTQRDQEIIDGKACAWCGDLLHHASNNVVDATYCSFQCAEEGRIRRGGMYSSARMRNQIFSLEHGVCCLCGLDAHALYRKILSLHPAERLNALMNAKFKLPKSSVALQKLLQDPKECDFWQADHITAVAEGGGGCGLDNIRTLCTTCHNIETEKLMSRLKTTKADEKQLDIHAAFSMSQDKKVASAKNKRKRTAD